MNDSTRKLGNKSFGSSNRTKIDFLKTDRNKLELNFFDSIKVRISSYQKMENKSPVFIPLPFNSNNLKICSKIDNYVNESKCNH